MDRSSLTFATPHLLVIDLQPDFLRQPRAVRLRPEIVDAVNTVARVFRARGAPVTWVRTAFRPDLTDAFLEMRRDRLEVAIEGTPGAELLPELEVEPSDAVVVKKRYSAFFGTELDARLASAGAAPLVVAGVNTHACVRTTIVDAYQRDLPVITVADGVGSFDEAHDRITRSYLDGKMTRFLDAKTIADALAA